VANSNRLWPPTRGGWLLLGLRVEGWEL